MTSKSTLVLALAVATAGIALAQDATPSRDHALATALIARSPHTSIPPEMDMFAPLLGSWEIQGTEWPEPGKPKKTTVKVAFGRVLGGRAIQDVWAFSEPGGAAEPTLGTTLRLYDPVERVWRITWLDPSSRLRLQLTARKVGDDIVQVGADPAGRPRRWTFSEIRPTSFVWRSEYLDDDGRSWVLRVECFAKRVARD
jgi:hypothetical protein